MILFIAYCEGQQNAPNPDLLAILNRSQISCDVVTSAAEQSFHQTTRQTMYV